MVPVSENLIKCQRGFSTVVVIILSAVVGTVMLGVLLLTTYSSKSVERSIAFSHFAILNQQLTVMLRSQPDSLWNAGAQNSCTRAFTAGGVHTFNTATNSVSPAMRIYNPDGTIFLDPADNTRNKVGTVTVSAMNLVSRGQVGADTSLYKAKLVLQTTVADGGTTKTFRDDSQNNLNIWVLIRTATPGPGIVNIQSCTSNFFYTGDSTDPLPMPVCTQGQVLYARELSGSTGIANSVYCVRILCPKPDGSVPPANTGWGFPSSYAPDGNGNCP